MKDYGQLSPSEYFDRLENLRKDVIRLRKAIKKDKKKLLKITKPLELRIKELEKYLGLCDIDVGD